MSRSTARIAMETPTRYLTQLGKHFQHRLPVTLETDHGTIDFPGGLCTLDAVDTHLVIQIDAAEPTDLTRLQDVVAKHLLRFAFRAPPEIDWLAA